MEGAELGGDAIFDDKALINGYTDKEFDTARSLVYFFASIPGQ